MGKSKIEWTDKTWNPVTGCTKISAGCANCYAERVTKRFFPGKDFNKISLHPERLREPAKWKSPCKIFVCSMSDLFHADVPDDFILNVFDVMHQNPHHTFIVLTKRPERMSEMINGMVDDGSWGVVPGHVWIGVTAENQQMADSRIPILMGIPAAIHWVSIEPMLGPVDLTCLPGFYYPGCTTHNVLSGELIHHDDDMRRTKAERIDWVVCGCESGPGRRAMNEKWARDLMGQCQEDGVPFFLKQMELHGVLTKMPELDGQIWDEYPEVSPCEK